MNNRSVTNELSLANLNFNTSLINTKLLFANQSCFSLIQVFFSLNDNSVHNDRFTVNHQQVTLSFITIPFQLLLSEVVSVTFPHLEEPPQPNIHLAGIFSRLVSRRPLFWYEH